MPRIDNEEPVPELPELEVIVEVLNRRINGRQVESDRLHPSPLHDLCTSPRGYFNQRRIERPS